MNDDWRPPVGALVQSRGDDAPREVVAHFEGDGYGECIVVRRTGPGGWKAAVVMRSVWESAGFVVVG